MRMWMIRPSLLCDRHLLGEHLELHMLAGCIAKRRSVAGYVAHGLVELDKLNSRHDTLVNEMQGRGMKHDSPLDHIEYIGDPGKVALLRSFQDLVRRCPNCSRRILLRCMTDQML